MGLGCDCSFQASNAPESAFPVRPAWTRTSTLPRSLEGKVPCARSGADGRDGGGAARGQPPRGPLGPGVASAWPCRGGPAAVTTPILPR